MCGRHCSLLQVVRRGGRGVLLFSLLFSGCASATHQLVPITAFGYIEGEKVTVAAEVSGRVAAVLVERGDHVRAGQVVLRLDDALLRSQCAEAEAALAAAQANLARVQAGAREEDIAAARAGLAQAEAERDGAARAVLTAREAISHPLALQSQIDAARTQVRLAEQDVEQARAQLAEVELKYNLFTAEGASNETKRLWSLQVQAARAALAQAEANLSGQQEYLNMLLRIRARPLQLLAQLHQAEAKRRLAEAKVASAQAVLDMLLAGPTREQVAVAEAQVHQAQAAWHLCEAQLSQLTLYAPMDGVVSSCSVQPGEVAVAGVPLLTITSLDQVEVTIYVPEDRIGQVKRGQEAEVRVDSFPDRVFLGYVTRIADQAEFTPRSVQTEEERAQMVFAVKVAIPNPDHLLKPGMPADVVLRLP